MAELTEQEKEAINTEVLKRLDGIIKLHGGSSILDLPKETRDLMIASFQEGVKYWQEKTLAIQEEMKADADIPF